jgi:hypothetical protein
MEKSPEERLKELERRVEALEAEAKNAKGPPESSIMRIIETLGKLSEKVSKLEGGGERGKDVPCAVFLN